MPKTENTFLFLLVVLLINLTPSFQKLKEKQNSNLGNDRQL